MTEKKKIESPSGKVFEKIIEHHEELSNNYDELKRLIGPTIGDNSDLSKNFKDMGEKIRTLRIEYLVLMTTFGAELLSHMMIKAPKFFCQKCQKEIEDEK